MRINREQFNKWIKALRSGRYKQTKGTLQDRNGYCCLGVACKVLIPKNKLFFEVSTKTLLEGSMPDNQPNCPKWLSEINSDFRKRSKLKEQLTVLNDENNMSFKEIAKALQEAYPERKRK